MKPNNEPINSKEFLEDKLQEEELNKIVGGLESDDITLKSFEDTINKSIGFSKTSN